MIAKTLLSHCKPEHQCFSRASGRPVIVVADSGRLADEIAPSRMRNRLIHITRLEDGPQALKNKILSILKGEQNG